MALKKQQRHIPKADSTPLPLPAPFLLAVVNAKPGYLQDGEWESHSPGNDRESAHFDGILVPVRYLSKNAIPRSR